MRSHGDSVSGESGGGTKPPPAGAEAEDGNSRYAIFDIFDNESIAQPLTLAVKTERRYGC